MNMHVMEIYNGYEDVWKYIMIVIDHEHDITQYG